MSRLDPEYERAHARWREARQALSAAYEAFLSAGYADSRGFAPRSSSQRRQELERLEAAKRAEAEARAALKLPWEQGR